MAHAIPETRRLLYPCTCGLSDCQNVDMTRPDMSTVIFSLQKYTCSKTPLLIHTHDSCPEKPVLVADMNITSRFFVGLLRQ